MVGGGGEWWWVVQGLKGGGGWWWEAPGDHGLETTGDHRGQFPHEDFGQVSGI